MSKFSDWVALRPDLVNVCLDPEALEQAFSAGYGEGLQRGREITEQYVWDAVQRAVEDAYQKARVDLNYERKAGPE